MNRFKNYKIKITTFLLLIMVLSNNLMLSTSAIYNQSNNTYEIPSHIEFSDDIVIVGLTNQESMQFNEYSPLDFNEIDCESVKNLSVLSETSVKNAVNNLTRHITEGAKLELDAGINFSKFYKVLSLKLKHPGKDNVVKAINILSKRNDVLFAEPNYLYESYSAEPTDPYYTWQEPIVDLLDLQEAWDITTGSNSVMVGVIDSGIDITNPDLEDNIDEAKSRNFFDNSNPCIDDTGHGTFIAGIIGAKWNNDYVIAGVCENVSIISLKVTEYDEEDNKYVGNASAIKEAIEYAQARNIPILNYSYGNYQYSQMLEYAIDAYNGIFIASAGNDGLNTDIYPHYESGLDLDNIISVGACDYYGAIWENSNFGKISVDIFAPGKNIRSTFPIDMTSYGYENGSGTSFSAPYVAGVAALMLSINPNLTNAQIKSLIIRNVTTRPNLNDKCTSRGVINAYKAVNSVYMENEIEYGHNNSPTEHKVYLDICSECDCREPDGSCNNCGICDPCTNCHTILYSQLHNYATINSNNSMHTLYCLDCNYLLTSVHDWAYVATPTTHTAICRDCGFTQTSSNHSYIYTTDSIYHYGTCFSCGYEYQEYHNWTIENSKYRCTICMLAYTGIPPIIQSVPPIEDNHSE